MDKQPMIPIAGDSVSQPSCELMFRKPAIVSCKLVSADEVIGRNALLELLDNQGMDIRFFSNHILLKWHDSLFLLNGFSGTLTRLNAGLGDNAILEQLTSIELPMHFVFAKHARTNLCLTTECNLRCPYCFVSKDPSGNLSEMPPESVREFLAASSSAVSLYGGEPLLYLRKHRALYDYLSDQVGVVTNGTLASEVPFLVSKCVSLAVSLHVARREFISAIPSGTAWTGLLTLSEDSMEQLEDIQWKVAKNPPEVLSLNADYSFLKALFGDNGTTAERGQFVRRINSFLQHASLYTRIVVKPFGALFSPSFCPYVHGLCRSITVERQVAYCQAVITAASPRIKEFEKPPEGFAFNSLFTGCAYWEEGYDRGFWRRVKACELVILLSLITGRAAFVDEFLAEGLMI